MARAARQSGADPDDEDYEEFEEMLEQAEGAQVRILHLFFYPSKWLIPKIISPHIILFGATVQNVLCIM